MEELSLDEIIERLYQLGLVYYGEDAQIKRRTIPPEQMVAYDREQGQQVELDARLFASKWMQQWQNKGGEPKQYALALLQWFTEHPPR